MRKLSFLLVLLVVGLGVYYFKSSSKPEFEPAPASRESFAEPKVEKPVAATTPAPAPVATPQPSKELTAALPVTTNFSPEEKAVSVLAKTNELMRKENHEEAVKLLQEALRMNPENSDMQAELGAILANSQNNPVQALHHFSEALKSNPSNERALAETVNIASGGSSKEAAARGTEILRRVIQNNPKSPVPYIAMADLQARQNNMAGAINSLETASRLPGAPESAAMRLAHLYTQQQQPDRAAPVVDSVAKQREQKFRENPNPQTERSFDEARIDVGHNAMLRGDLRQADAILRPLAQKYPDNPALQRLFADVQGRIEGRPAAVPPGAPVNVPPPQGTKAE